MPKKPSAKQKNAVEKTLENLGSSNPKPMGEILLEVGYKPSIAETPSIVTESKGFKEWMNERMPDDLLTQRHLELLNKREIVKTFSHETGETEVELTDQPDTQAVSKALDMAYKLKGSYAAEKSVSLNLNVNENRSALDPAVQELREEFEKKLEAKFRE